MTNKELLGSIICINCEKEIESIFMNRVVTYYGICDSCKEQLNKDNMPHK